MKELWHNWETNECPPETYDNWTFMQNRVQMSTDVNNSCTLEMICFVPSTKHSEIPKEGEVVVRLDFVVDQFCSGLIQVYFTAVLSVLFKEKSMF